MEARLATRLKPSAYAQSLIPPGNELDADAFLALAHFLSAYDPLSGEYPDEVAADRERGELRLRIETMADGLREHGTEGEYSLAKSALIALHRDLLKTYAAEQTRVDTVLRDGSFNCVSSAILYVALVDRLGLTSLGVRTPDHAFIKLRLDQRWIDVETTNSLGFDPGHQRQEFSDAFGRVTGYAYVPPEQYSRRSDIDRLELLSLILYNRASELERRADFGSALALAIDRYALLPGQESMVFLADRANNLTVKLLNSGQNQLAVDLFYVLRDTMGQLPPRLSPSLEAVVHNRLVEFFTGRDYPGALAFWEKTRNDWGMLKPLPSFGLNIAKAWSTELMEAGRYDEALGKIQALSQSEVIRGVDAAGLKDSISFSYLSSLGGAHNYADKLALWARLTKDGDFSKANGEKALLYLASQEARRVSAPEDSQTWLSAAAAFTQAMELLPSLKELNQGREKALHNFEILTLKDSRLALASRGQEAALAILRAAILQYPGSRMLRDELSKLLGPNASAAK